MPATPADQDSQVADEVVEPLLELRDPPPVGELRDREAEVDLLEHEPKPSRARPASATGYVLTHRFPFSPGSAAGALLTWSGATLDRDFLPGAIDFGEIVEQVRFRGVELPVGLGAERLFCQ